MRTQHGRSIADFPYSPLAAALAVALAPQAAQATNIVVNSTSDSSYYQDATNGTSLRGALSFVNANCSGADKITFTSNGPFITSASTDLPTITCAGLTIDGGGTMGSPGAIIQATSYGSHSFGLRSTASSPTSIRGMGVQGWTYGTGLSGHLNADNNTIHGNSTGIDSFYPDNKVTNNAVFSNGTGIWVSYGGQVVTGNNIYSNDFEGLGLIEMTSGTVSNNVIGINAGSFAGNETGIYAYGNKVSITNNTIGANSEALYFEEDLGSTISSNHIGLDATNAAFGNSMGVYLYDSTGTTFTGNVLSETYGGAVEIHYGANITLSNNKIGTDSSGTQFFGNNEGLLVECSSNVSVQGNIIANWYGGTGIQFNGVTGGGSLDIVNNKINVAGDGVTSLGGMSYGVILRDACGTPLALRVKSATGTAKKSHVKHARVKSLTKAAASTGATTNVMVSGNKIRYISEDSVLVNGGFNSTVTGNTIMYGGGYGVNVAFGSGIKITDNKVYGNGTSAEFQKNVSLVEGPVYHNTTGALQPTVPNDGQDAPTITSVTRNYTNNTTLVAFSFHGPAGSYLVQVCQNSPISTVPGCSQVVGSKTVEITSGTSVSDSITVPSVTADYFSAILTSNGNKESSEFSDVVAVVPMPAATYVPTSHDFGNVGVNGASKPFTITISSTGATPYVIDSLNSPGCEGPGLCYGGSFTCTTTCTPGTNYNPGQTCTIKATFNPTTTGLSTTMIGICDNVYGGTITLSGTGVPMAPFTLSPNPFDFGPQGAHSQGPAQTFTVTNPTTSTVSVGAVGTSSSDFVITSDNCPPSLPANGTCAVDVAFNPQSAGLITGTLGVSSGGALGSLQIKRLARSKAETAPTTAPATASLQGTGTVTAGLSLPSAVDLGTYTSGDPANSRNITITNNGNAVLSITSVTSTGPFTITNGCPTSIQPDASCTISVSYAAPDLGDHTGSITIVANVDGGARTITLTGSTVGSPIPRITVSPAAIGFGDRLLGTQSATQRITITNIGNAPATLSTGVTTPDFLVATSNCTTTLAPASSCFADVMLRPVGFGPRVGTFEVDSNAQGSPFVVKLSGSGCRPYSAGSSRLGSSFSCAP
jgi:trimeric autotransporter adhesin